MKKAFLLLTIFSSLFADLKTEELKQTVTRILPTLEGWCSKEKAMAFVDLILEVKPNTCVEIGVFGGSSAFPVASTLKFLDHGLLIAIDPWDKIECIKYFDPIEDAEHLKWWGNLNINYIYYAYLNMLKKYDLEDYVTTIRSTSEDAAQHIDEIDILYIDGNHSEQVSCLDVELYLPKVRPGGYIWYNDALWKDRQDAIDQLMEECEIIKVIEDGNCILFQKRGP
ncbi:MAG: class I SAM-dependent methyltransferase [Parachlamydiales bacterium]|nr:class I SAM-dependent methyltransferase [Parachlamydiales bacterium]